MNSLVYKRSERGLPALADFHHKTALKIIREFDAVVIEDLNISGLLKNHHSG